MGEIVERPQRHDAAGQPAGSVELYRAALGAALEGYAWTREPSMLDQAFAAAAAAIQVLRGVRASEPCNTIEARTMMSMLPELDRLASVAVQEAERSLHARACALWERLGLRTPAPRWHELERSEARVLVVRACAVIDGRGPRPFRSRLSALAAARWAALLATELRADEDLWRVALAERYPSVRRRHAPRAGWRTPELSERLAGDPQLAQAVHAQLARWLADSWDFSRLPAELEAAFVPARAGRISWPESDRRKAHPPRHRPERTADR